MNKQTAPNSLDLFESTHLVYRLKPFGYGKEVPRVVEKRCISRTRRSPARCS